MAKKDKENFENIEEKLNSKYSFQLKKEVVPTSSMGLNIASAVGGIGVGKIIRINGKEGAGKTTLVAEIIASFQRAGKKCKYFDYEYSIDVDYMATLGVNTEGLFIYPETLEEGYDVAIELMRTGNYGLIIFDSLNSMPPKVITTEAYAAGDSIVAVQSRIHSMMFPILKSTAARNHCSVIGIAQNRANIGSFGAGNDVSKAPGNAWLYYPDIAITVGRLKTTKEDNTFKNSVEFDKNKLGTPFGRGAIHYVGGEGIDIAADILFYGELSGVIKRVGNTYMYGETKLGVGLNGVRAFFEDNVDYLKELFKEVQDSVEDIRISTK